MQMPGLIWDTCTLLNLVASGQVEEVFSALGCQNYIVQEVRLEEALYLRPLPDDEAQGSLIAFDLSPYLEDGSLVDVELTSTERVTFVGFARSIDDGEAKTAAAAKHRGFWVATDDRRALRLLKSLTPPVPTLTTLQWLKLWADKTAISAKVLGQVLRDIRIRARYRPRNTDPLYDWWERHFPGDA